MAVAALGDWLTESSEPEYFWIAKRLAGNDTLATGGHQVGPYISKELLFRVLPQIDAPDARNPDVVLDIYIDSHRDHRQARAVWYNNKLHSHDGTRNETRLTRFGGSSSALLDPENTGTVAVFVFREDSGSRPVCHVWVCEHSLEDDLVEEWIGPVEPGQFVTWPAAGFDPDTVRFPPLQQPCWLQPDQIPSDWIDSFPTGSQLVEKTLQLRPLPEVPPDPRLIKRRDCEYELFRSIERAVELPVVQTGFGSLEAFISRAQRVLQRRKSRAGRSLELHVRALFMEEGLREGHDFCWHPESEPGKEPDFLFPTESDYRNPNHPESRLRMLAIKTTCKDRWRQVLNEADRIRTKHILTLQQGVSVNQFREMMEANIRLVVPEPMFTSFPSEIRPHLLSVESFMADIRLLRSP